MEDFVSYEIAKKLKEKGFREECLYHYIGKDLVSNIESPIGDNQLWFSHNKFDNIWHRDNYDAPTIEQVLKWLRDNKKTMFSILPVAFNEKENKFTKYYCTIYYATEEFVFEMHERPETFETYEECALEAIEYAIDKLI